MLFAVVVKGLIRRAVFSCEAAVFTDIFKISVFGTADIRFIKPISDLSEMPCLTHELEKRYLELELGAFCGSSKRANS